MKVPLSMGILAWISRWAARDPQHKDCEAKWPCALGLSPKPILSKSASLPVFSLARRSGSATHGTLRK